MKKIIRFAGGLANRMFQYCFYLNMIEKQYQARIDDSTPPLLPHEDIQWNSIFPNAKYVKASKWDCIKNGGGFDVVSKMVRHYSPFPTSCKIMNNANYPDDATLKKYNYFIGLMFDIIHCEAIKPKVISAFKFANFNKNSGNECIANLMHSQNSVSIHVRMGKDYTADQRFMGCCTLEYYRKAIALIKEKVDNPVFYIFTDNPDWVKDNFTDFEYTLVDWNPTTGWGNHFDMQLMGCCKHNIIANSTYSWWGAYLNPFPDKIVIAPRYWFNPKVKKCTHRTACNGWILL